MARSRPTQSTHPRVRLGDINVDHPFTVRHAYPAQVRNMLRALKQGCQFPPVMLTRVKYDGQHWTIDGCHRHDMWWRHAEGLGLDPEDFEIEAILQDYPEGPEGLQELFDDIARSNSNHGAAWTTYDRARMVNIASAHGLSIERLAGALFFPTDQLGELRTTRNVIVDNGDGTQSALAIKKPVEHMHGRLVQRDQVHGINAVKGGRSQLQMLNELIHLAEEDLLDRASGHVMSRVGRLYRALATYVAATGA